MHFVLISNHWKWMPFTLDLNFILNATIGLRERESGKGNNLAPQFSLKTYKIVSVPKQSGCKCQKIDVFYVLHDKFWALETPLFSVMLVWEYRTERMTGCVCKTDKPSRRQRPEAMTGDTKIYTPWFFLNFRMLVFLRIVNASSIYSKPAESEFIIKL